MRTARSAQILLALSTALLALTGCNRQNHSLQIGQQIDLETFRNTQASPAASSPSTTGVLANTSSQVGVRSWAQSEILVPNDGVYHRPLYKTEYSRVKFTARNRGDFPTAETCLDLQDPRATWEQIGETFVFTPSVVAYDAVTAPFRMAIHPATQSNVKVSPRLPRPGYQRTLPAAGSAGQEVSATADSAATAPASTNATPPASTEPLAPIKVEPTK
jgi:hypothetical protein